MNLHVLDFSSPDITKAIEELKSMDAKGDLSGFMFVCKTKNKMAVGAAGCCATDNMAKIGAAAYLFGAVMDNTFNE